MPQRPAAPGSGPSAGHRRRRLARSGRPASPRRPSSSGLPQTGRSRGPAAPRPVVSELERALTAALSAPAPAEATFAELGLPGPLVTALAEQGINAPFAIQARALPDALAGRDVLGRAQTGSGKTLAFGLPLLARLASAAGRRQPRAPRGLVLVPTRELARQVAEVSPRWAAGSASGSPPCTAVPPWGGRSTSSAAGSTSWSPRPAGYRPDRPRCGQPGPDRDRRRGRGGSHGRPGLPACRDPAARPTPPDGQRMLFSATLDRDVDRLVTRPT